MIAGIVLAAVRQAAAIPGPEDARRGVERGLEFLLRAQEPDGAWGHWRNPEVETGENPEAHRSWQVAVTSLGCLAMMEAGAGEASMQALDRAVGFLCARALVKRPSDWDVDNVWAYVYGLTALARAATFQRYEAADHAERRAAMRATGEKLIEKLWRYQTPSGGWAYYDDETKALRPSWATSFTTAVGVLGLLDAQSAGWPVDRGRLARAVAAVRRCRLPSGAYTYSVEVFPGPGDLENIDQVKGSLSRIQVCNLALFRAAQAGLETGIGIQELRAGLEPFFREHRFLDVARRRPIPHEAFYYNSGYFYFFGHYYAAQVIRELPEEDRRRFAPLLWREILKTQCADGSMWDYYMNDYGRPYGASYGVAALGLTLAALEPAG